MKPLDGIEPSDSASTIIVPLDLLQNSSSIVYMTALYETIGFWKGKAIRWSSKVQVLQPNLDKYAISRFLYTARYEGTTVFAKIFPLQALYTL